jgi:hypothetical protein
LFQISKKDPAILTLVCLCQDFSLSRQCPFFDTVNRTNPSNIVPHASNYTKLQPERTYTTSLHQPSIRRILSKKLRSKPPMAAYPQHTQLQQHATHGFVNHLKSHSTTFSLQTSYNHSSQTPPASGWRPAQPYATKHTNNTRPNLKPSNSNKSLKRTAGDINRAKNKKQKTRAQPKQVTDEDFRTADTQQLHAVQPIRLSPNQIPLTNVERWRLRGWTWQEAFMTMKTGQREAESPTGTSLLWGV